MSKKPEMTTERESAILEKAIHKYGEGSQVVKAVEELGELITALTKFLNGQGSRDAIRSEMADCYIMLNQLSLIFGDCVEEEIFKLERLEARMEADKCLNTR